MSVSSKNEPKPKFLFSKADFSDGASATVNYGILPRAVAHMGGIECDNEVAFSMRLVAGSYGRGRHLMFYEALIPTSLCVGKGIDFRVLMAEEEAHFKRENLNCRRATTWDLLRFQETAYGIGRHVLAETRRIIALGCWYTTESGIMYPYLFIRNGAPVLTVRRLGEIKFRPDDLILYVR